MKKSLTVLLAVLMMLFAVGCYGNTQGTTRSFRGYDGMNSDGFYNGVYDGTMRESYRNLPATNAPNVNHMPGANAPSANIW